MTLELFLLLLLLAAAGTVLVIVVGSQGRIGNIRVDRRTGIVVSAAVLVLWGLVALNSFEVTIHSGGETTVEEYEQIAWLAVAGAGIALYSLFQATLLEIRETGGI